MSPSLEVFGPCWDQSGLRNFFGEGYPYHKYFRYLGLNLTGSTFVAKTTTFLAREGNMPLGGDGVTPVEFHPKCIVVDFPRGCVLNAVGLSGPGLADLLSRNRWQDIKTPYMLSFMSVEKTAEGRLNELRQFVNMLLKLDQFAFLPALQINFSCPNVKVVHEMSEFVHEVIDALAIASILGVPLIPKFNVLLPVEVAYQISQSPYCSAISISNSLPWGTMPDKVNWYGMFGSKGKSPLEHLGGGGLSGAPLLPLVADWVIRARKRGIKIHINAGGGILHPNHVETLFKCGASSVAIGTVGMLRPWRVQSIIRRAYNCSNLI